MAKVAAVKTASNFVGYLVTLAAIVWSGGSAVYNTYEAISHSDAICGAFAVSFGLIAVAGMVVAHYYATTPPR